MELPALKLPDITLPFDIPTLMHPPIIHFAIAIPVLVIFIEIINLIVKKRAIGILTFFMLVFGMVATAIAYKTGTVDGKEAFDALTQAGQAELKEHKNLGTYLVIGSAIVLLFKIVAATIQKGLIKVLYLLVLTVFIAGLLKQGKDGGELVYEYGANVERVQSLEDALFDAQEEADEAAKAVKKTAPAPAPAKAEEAKAETKAPVHQEATPIHTAVEQAKEAVDEAAAPVVEATHNAEAKVEEAVHTAVEQAQEVTHKVQQATEHPAVPEVAAPAATDVLPHH